ncbi:protein tramtrack, beta isoform-like isoform X15 [Euwallacea similis]|uniref:protein tramtrack, beta isoform-like isoform X15 n=1 Tax=Euwallacea similis TaxID=1736056 RepID=UPI00344EA748
MASEQFSLCWDNFHKNMSSGMNSLLESGDLVDVTLAVEGKFLKAHKMVLSVCSPYFKELFKTNPCQHPIVFMKDVSYVAISDLLQFMYQGEVQVSQDNLTTFIKTAEALQIKGLTGDGNGSTDADSEPVQEKPTRHIDESYKPSPRPKKQLPAPVVTTTPAVKRPRLSASSNDSQSAPIAIAKTEPSSTGVDSSSVQFKVEPYDLNQSVTIPDDGDDNFDENLDDNTVDDTEDYSMMEGEEPQAGTSTDGTGEGQGKVMTELKKVNNKLDLMQRDVLRLMLLVESMSKIMKKESAEGTDEWGLTLPITSFDQLMSMEQVLDIPEKYSSLMDYVKQIGGYHLQEITQRSMSRILDLNIAIAFSWFGKKGKLPLKDYKVASVLKESILQSAKGLKENTTERDVEKSIMDWLKYAPQRRKARTEPPNSASSSALHLLEDGI